MYCCVPQVPGACEAGFQMLDPLSAQALCVQQHCAQDSIFGWGGFRVTRPREARNGLLGYLGAKD